MALQTEEEVIEAFLQFFRNFTDDEGDYPYLNEVANMIRDEGRSIIIDYQDLRLMDDSFELDLISTLEETPDLAISIAGKAVEQLTKDEDKSYYEFVKENDQNFYARFSNCPFTISLRNIRSQNLGHYKVLEGIIIKASEVRPLIIEGVYYCNLNPEHRIIMTQKGGIYTPPNSCVVQNCASKNFTLSQVESKHIDWQTLTIQEIQEDLPAGTTPTSVTCRLLDDLVIVVRPGDKVTLGGIVRTRPAKQLKKGQQLIFEIWIDTNFIELRDKDFEQLEITESEEQKFTELAQNPNLNNILIGSIAQQVKGLRLIKEGILYFMFGGVDKIHDEGFKTRGQPNILLVGDPSMGKSQLLKFTHSIASRSIYTSGKGSSAAGLTAAISRDQDTGQLTLEAGAMVLADQGITLIDEFEKMDVKDRSAIHEAMEQGTVSIAKAGIVATLNSRTGVLAAANPIQGYYNKSIPLRENINLGSPILSRFDLIFVLSDEPDEDKDTSLANHILNLHSNYKKVAENQITLSAEELKKYIIFAKQKITPILSHEALVRIRDFYVKTRNLHKRQGAEENYVISFTPRQLEGIIRLAEARAKMSLKSVVTKEHADAAINLMSETLKYVAIDPETGEIDSSQIFSDVSRKKGDKIGIVMQVVRECNNEYKGSPIPKDELVEKAERKGLAKVDVEKILKELLRSGTIYEPTLKHFNLLG